MGGRSKSEVVASTERESKQHQEGVSQSTSMSDGKRPSRTPSRSLSKSNQTSPSLFYSFFGFFIDLLALGGRSFSHSIKDVVYGGLDGLITTHAIVSGVSGGSLSSSVVLVLGISNLLADGFSMAVGNYMGTKAEIEMERKERKVIEESIETQSDQRKEDIRTIYRKKGFKDADLERIVEVITSDRKVWLDTLIAEAESLRKSSLPPNGIVRSTSSQEGRDGESSSPSSPKNSKRVTRAESWHLDDPVLYEDDDEEVEDSPMRGAVYFSGEASRGICSSSSGSSPTEIRCLSRAVPDAVRGVRRSDAP
eukprot:TRINITY_DN5111_c0_g1_i1.p1 TRINITY_DN5111_c0_g1~~TRINITY_DN5111_c0_g1_i1.p1  ORF type:complete len:308 (-),score=27.08 TRINITY_DN5111_c0_g1_i1:30-953(-)